MNDQHPKNNKILHELMGKDWHDQVDSEGHCSCGKMHSKKLWPDDLNPDYAATPRLVLEWLVNDLILDKTGRLRDLAIEFLKSRGNENTNR